jgi:hypothetical protein
MRRWLAIMLLGVSVQAAAAGMSSNDFVDFRGQYRLTDGRTLTMRTVGRQQIAEIDGLGPIEIIAIDDATFVAKDGGLKLAFRRWGNGTVTAVSMDVLH